MGLLFELANAGYDVRFYAALDRVAARLTTVRDGQIYSITRVLPTDVPEDVWLWELRLAYSELVEAVPS